MEENSQLGFIGIRNDFDEHDESEGLPAEAMSVPDGAGAATEAGGLTRCIVDFGGLMNISGGGGFSRTLTSTTASGDEHDGARDIAFGTVEPLMRGMSVNLALEGAERFRAEDASAAPSAPVQSYLPEASWPPRVPSSFLLQSHSVCEGDARIVYDTVQVGLKELGVDFASEDHSARLECKAFQPPHYMAFGVQLYSIAGGEGTAVEFQPNDCPRFAFQRIVDGLNKRLTDAGLCGVAVVGDSQEEPATATADDELGLFDPLGPPDLMSMDFAPGMMDLSDDETIEDEDVDQLAKDAVAMAQSEHDDVAEDGLSHMLRLASSASTRRALLAHDGIVLLLQVLTGSTVRSVGARCLASCALTKAVECDECMAEAKRQRAVEALLHVVQASTGLSERPLRREASECLLRLVETGDLGLSGGSSSRSTTGVATSATAGAVAPSLLRSASEEIRLIAQRSATTDPRLHTLLQGVLERIPVV